MALLINCYRDDINVYRTCCYPERSDELPTDEDMDAFAKDTKNHLDNLPTTYFDDLSRMDIVDRREYMLKQTMFRVKKCAKSGMTCCGSCSVRCKVRCPQDVMHRAYLIIIPIKFAGPKGSEEQKAAYAKASTMQQMMYDELTSEHPRYKVIYAMLMDYINPRHNKQLGDSIKYDYKGYDTPMRFDYSPQIEYETYRTFAGHITTRRKVDPETGNIAIRYWPDSGLCPFCLPQTTVDRHKRYDGVKKRKSSKRDPNP